jgi:hypothetical protein
VAGHGRIEALREIFESGGDPPNGIAVEHGQWLVPVVCGLSFKDETEAAAYLVAENRLTELGGWNESDLAELLEDLAKKNAIQGIGYDADDIDELLRSLELETDFEAVEKTEENSDGVSSVIKVRCPSSCENVVRERVEDAVNGIEGVEVV